MDPSEPYDKLHASRLASAAVNSAKTQDRGSILQSLHKETGTSVANKDIQKTMKNFGKGKGRKHPKKRKSTKKRKPSRN